MTLRRLPLNRAEGAAEALKASDPSPAKVLQLPSGDQDGWLIDSSPE